MVSDEAQLILTSVIFMVIYWLSYFGPRKRVLNPGRRAKVYFAMNMILGVTMMGGYQLYLLREFALLNSWLVLTTMLIAASIMAHHLAIFAIARKSKRRSVHLIHGVISHVLFSLAFAINAVAIGSRFWTFVVSPADTLIFTIFAGLATVSILGTFLVGWGFARGKYLQND